MTGDIDPNLVHDRDCLGPDKAWRNPGAEYFKAIAGQMTQQAFGHLAARRVAGAEKEHALLFSHQSSFAARRALASGSELSLPPRRIVGRAKKEARRRAGCP